MFDWLKSKLPKGRVKSSSDYKKVYSKTQQILDDPVKYVRKNTDFSSPEEVKKLFESKNVAIPQGWTAEEIYYLTKRNAEDKLPSTKSPKEVKDIAVKISLIALEFSVSWQSGDGAEISQAIIAIYDHHEDYNTWPSAIKFTLLNAKEAEKYLEELYDSDRKL